MVTVERGWSVHCRWHDGRRSYYVRVGSESREASPEELQRLFQQRGAFRLEIRPVSGTSMEDLDMRRIRDYFERIRGQAMPGASAARGTRVRLNAIVRPYFVS